MDININKKMISGISYLDETMVDELWEAIKAYVDVSKSYGVSRTAIRYRIDKKTKVDNNIFIDIKQMYEGLNHGIK